VTDPRLWWASSISAEALDRIEYPPPRYIHRETGFPRGGVVLLAGSPKSGKSYMALGLALATAEAGHPYGSHEPVGASGPVLALMLDDNSRRHVQQRLRDISGGRPLPASLTVHTDHNLGAGRTAADNLGVYLAEHPKTALVIVDTLEHIREDKRPGESSYRADVRALTYVRHVAAAHPATTFLCLVHTRKGDDEDPIEAISGTHGVSGGADALLVLSGKRGTSRRRLDVISRDDGDKSLVMSLGRTGLTLTREDPDDPSALTAPDDARVYRAVREFPTGVTAAELSGVLPDLPKIGNRLARLEKAGSLYKASRGTYVIA
jgi:hypothetical protein